MSERSYKIIGHRGAKGLQAEYTKASFAKAIELGVDMIELDVRVSKDGVPVITHDQELKNYLIKDTSLRQLKTIHPALLTLSEGLAITGSTPLMIEVKPHVDCQPIFEILKQVDPARLETYQIASFDPKVLKKFMREFPEITRVIIEKWSGVRAGFRARRLRTKHITMRSSALWSYYISAVTKRGTILNSYTLNNPKKAKRFIRAGLTGVITDFPDRYKK